MKLLVDNRSGIYNQDIINSNVDNEEAISWLKKLDGNQHTLLNLDRADGSHFMVGGGPKWYIVTLDTERQNLTLQNINGTETKMIELCAGGQYGEYPESFCVNQEQAAVAISLFFNENELQAKWI